ncbi:MAG TPA: VOC family protein [Nordella sp.]|nr:VOC family protein [Nordella sp.]
MKLHYVTLGSNDLAKSKTFYNAALAPLGYTCLFESDGMIGYGDEAPVLYLIRPFDGAKAGGGNGTMLALTAPTRTDVDAFHRDAMANGGTNEGDPGIRESVGPNFYAAYVRDPDGNKLSAVCEAA